MIIVGPAGRATDRYRADGDRAAKVARAAGASVTTVYSPDATWPTVKAALQGASIVVYMGHGNGFPSRYGPVLSKATKNGLGLNPVAGVDDVAHQYFGEMYLAHDVRLAPHAVVLLHHLCYASGNSEPGLPEGDLASARQRVDNMAAGWLAAGADAVLAEAYGAPDHYVGKILAGRSTIEAIWRTGTTAHGNVLAFPSVRTPGMTGLMDPTRKSSGFFRSLVVRAQMRADEVAAGAAMISKRTAPAAAPPSPSARTMPAISRVTLAGTPTARAQLDLDLAFDSSVPRPTNAVGVGVRWDPIALDEARPVASPSPPIAPSTATPGSSAGPRPSIQPDPAAASPTSVPSAGPLVSTQPSGSRPLATAETSPSVGTSRQSPSTPAGDAPAFPQLVTPETFGDVVALVDVTVDASRLMAPVVVPDDPGLYRLVVTIHDGEGVALGAEVASPVPALLVRVTSPLSAVMAASRHIDVEAGSRVDLPVVVMNSGTVSWVGDANLLNSGDRRAAGRAAPAALLVGHWVRLDASDDPTDERPVAAQVDAAPGATDAVRLEVTAPAVPGDYLLVLDVVSRVDGSLTAKGSEPVVVRVTVEPRGALGGVVRPGSLEAVH